MLADLRCGAVLRALAVALTLTVVAHPAAYGAEDARAARVKAAFEQWVARHNVTNASLAVAIDGVVVGGAGHGRYSPSLPVPVASLSKAITGVCIAQLVEAGRLRFDAGIGGLLSGFFDKHPPRDARVRSITVAELLTHTSGIAAGAAPGGSLNAFRPFSEVSTARQVTGALSVPLRNAPGEVFDYNNMNYAVLGLIIEAATGETYEDYCRETVLVPAGAARASFNPEWRVMGAYGGWLISAEDYARFLRWFDPSTGLLTIPSTELPRAKTKGGFYGIGIIMRPTAPGFDLSHFGGWTWTGRPKASFGAFFGVWQDGVTIVVNYAPIPKGAGADLAKSLHAAAFP